MRKMSVVLLMVFILTLLVDVIGKAELTKNVFFVQISHKILLSGWSPDANSFYFLTENKLSLISNISRSELVSVPVKISLLKNFVGNTEDLPINVVWVPNSSKILIAEYINKPQIDTLELRVWDYHSLKCTTLLHIKVPQYVVKYPSQPQLTYSPNGKFLAVTFYDIAKVTHSALIIDCISKHVINTFNQVEQLYFVNNRATISRDLRGNVRIVDLVDNKVIYSIANPKSNQIRAVCAANGNIFSLARQTRRHSEILTVTKYILSNGKMDKLFVRHFTPVSRLIYPTQEELYPSQDGSLAIAIPYSEDRIGPFKIWYLSKEGSIYSLSKNITDGVNDTSKKVTQMLVLGWYANNLFYYYSLSPDHNIGMDSDTNVYAKIHGDKITILKKIPFANDPIISFSHDFKYGEIERCEYEMLPPPSDSVKIKRCVITIRSVEW